MKICLLSIKVQFLQNGSSKFLKLFLLNDVALACNNLSKLRGNKKKIKKILFYNKQRIQTNIT